MGNNEFSPIGPQLNALEIAGSKSESVSQLTTNYNLSVRRIPENDSHLVQLLPRDSRYDTPGNVAIVTSVRYDQDGNFTGLIRQSETTANGTHHSVLTIWVAIDATKSVMVSYDVDPNDASKARIINVKKQYGPVNWRISKPTPAEQWDNLLEKTLLPRAFDIPTTIHRILFGKDFRTGQNLTDSSLEVQRLVPFVG